MVRPKEEKEMIDLLEIKEFRMVTLMLKSTMVTEKG